MMRKFLLWLFPDLQSELDTLRSGNSKLVVENSRLLDQIYNPVDVSIAKQLEVSAARNARMTNRLKTMQKHYSSKASITISSFLESIIKDEEPIWPDL